MANPSLILPVQIQGRPVQTPLRLSRTPDAGTRADVGTDFADFELKDRQTIYLFPVGIRSAQTLPEDVDCWDLTGKSVVRLSGAFEIEHGCDQCRLALITYGEDGRQNGLTAVPLNARAVVVDLPENTARGVIAIRLAGAGRFRPVGVDAIAREGGGAACGSDADRFKNQNLRAVEGAIFEEFAPGDPLVPGATYEVSVAVSGWTPECGGLTARLRGGAGGSLTDEVRIRLAASADPGVLLGRFRCPADGSALSLIIEGNAASETLKRGDYVLLQRVSPGINLSWMNEQAGDRDHYRPLQLPDGPLPPPAPPLAGDLTVAFIGSREAYAALSADLDVVVPDVNDWALQLADKKVRFLLLETSWRTSDPNWRHALRGGLHADRLQRLIDWCQGRAIPVFLWAHEDPGSLHPYAWLASHCQHIFYVDEPALKALNTRSSRPASHIGHVVNTRDFNPIRPFALSLEDDRSRRTPVLDGFWDATKREALLNASPAQAGEFHVVESIWSHSPARLEDLAALRSNALGALDYEARRMLARHCRSFISYADGPVPPWLRGLRALERAASGATTLLLGETTETAPVPGRRTAASLDDALQAAASWLDHPLRYERSRFDAFRKAASTHSFTRFIVKLLAAAGIDREPASPTVAAVLSTMRPHLIDRAVGWFNAQTYDKAELIVLVHGDDGVPESIKHLASDRVRLTSLGRSRTLGECLNFASSLTEAEYIAKIDDDDYYGPNYLANFALYTSMYDIDLCGKAVACFEIEADGVFWSEARARRSWTYLPPRHPNNPIAGGTIVARREILEDIGFPEDRRGGSDTAFLRRCFSEGLGALTLDPFDYALFRSDQAGFHTWNLDTAPLREAGFPLSKDWRDEIST